MKTLSKETQEECNVQRKCYGAIKQTFTQILWNQQQVTVSLSSDLLSQSLMTTLLLLSSSFLSQMTAMLLLSSSFLSQMTALLLLSSSFLSQITALRISSSFLSQWLHLKPSPQWLQQWLRQWLKSPQQELQQQTRQEISLTSAKQLKLNTRQEAQAFCIPPRKRLTMQHKEISCCILFETIQQLR